MNKNNDSEQDSLDKQRMPTKRELRLAAKANEIGAYHLLVKHADSSNSVNDSGFKRQIAVVGSVSPFC